MKTYENFDDIEKFGKFNLTTNSAEVINRKLKKDAGHGVITFARACQVLKNFKED